VTVPVLLIAGDRDTTTVPAASEYMKEKLRRSDLMVAGPAKHMGVVEQNRQYYESVRTFANACFGRTTQSASIARSSDLSRDRSTVRAPLHCKGA
jgi:hypothetical protein